MTAGRPMAEAPRDGSVIIAEQMHIAGVPETGHAGYERVQWSAEHYGFIREPDPKHPNWTVGYGDPPSALIQWWPADTPADQLEQTPRTNWNFRPGNGSHGDAIYHEWCDNCVHERPVREDYEHAVANELVCKIFLRSLIHDIDEPDYPTEWTFDRETGRPKCTAFEKDEGEPAKEPRCPLTPDLFP